MYIYYYSNGYAQVKLNKLKLRLNIRKVIS